MNARLIVFAVVIAYASAMFAGGTAKDSKEKNMEYYGGYKARQYTTDANGNMVTSSGVKVRDYRNDLSDAERQEMIVAAKMASSGYPDVRQNDYKSDYYGDGKTDYEEVSEAALSNIVEKAKNVNKDTDLRIVTEKGVLFISGKNEGRLNARVFIKDDGTVGLVFGGTDGFGDMLDDAKQVVHFAPTPKAYKEAAELLKAVKLAYPNTNINVYGHSEGGGEAMYAVLSEGVHNGETGQVKCYGVNSAGLNGLKTTNVINPELTREEIEANFVLIQNKGEKLGGKLIPVSGVAYQFGSVVLIPDYGDVYTGTEEHVDSNGSVLEKYRSRSKPDLEKTNLDHQHGIEDTLWKMTHTPSDLTNSKSNLVNESATGNDDPFDAQPETSPSSDGAGATSTGGRPSSLPSSQRRNGGSIRGGGGNTSCRF